MDPGNLASLGNGTLAVASEAGDLVVLVGLDAQGEQAFEHTLDPELLGITGDENYGLTAVAARGPEDELLVAMSTAVVSIETSTGAINWVLDDEQTTEIGWGGDGPIMVHGLSASPTGRIVAYGASHSGVRGLHVMRLDPETGTSLWQSSRWSGDNHYQDCPEDIVADSGSFGVLFAVTKDVSSNGCSPTAVLERYDLDTGAQRPAVLGQGSCNSGRDESPECVVVLEDGAALVVVGDAFAAGPNGERSTEVQRWSVAGELESSTAVPGHYSVSCSAVAVPEGGAYVLTFGGGPVGHPAPSSWGDLVLQVFPDGDIEVVLDDASGRRVDIALRPNGALAVLRRTSSGNASVRQYCFD